MCERVCVCVCRCVVRRVLFGIARSVEHTDVSFRLVYQWRGVEKRKRAKCTSLRHTDFELCFVT